MWGRTLGKAVHAAARVALGAALCPCHDVLLSFLQSHAGTPESPYVRPLSGTFWFDDDSLGALALAAPMGGSTGLEWCGVGCAFCSVLGEAGAGEGRLLPSLWPQSREVGMQQGGGHRTGRRPRRWSGARGLCRGLRVRPTWPGCFRGALRGSLSPLGHGLAHILG